MYLDEEVPASTLSQAFFALRHDRKQPTSSSSKNLQANVLQEIRAMAGIKDNDEVEITTLAGFIAAFSNDAYCLAAIMSVGKPDTNFGVDSDGLLARSSILDGPSQQVVLASLRPCLLYFCHYLILLFHPGKCRLYITMRKEFYWPQMAYDVYCTVLDCGCYAQNRTYGVKEGR